MSREPLENTAVESGFMGSTRVQIAEAILVLFVWFSVALLCGLANAKESLEAAAGLFVSASFCSLTTVALVMLLATSVRDLRVLTFAAYLILTLTPVWAFGPQTTLSVTLIDLFYVLLVATPVLFRAWGWKLQAVASAVVLLPVAWLWIPQGLMQSLRPLAVVGASAVLSGFAAYVRRGDETGRKLQAQHELSKMSAQVQSRLPLRAWSALALQIYLLGVLVFLDFALAPNSAESFLLPHSNALLAVILGGLLLSIVRPRYLGSVMICITTVVTLILASAGIGEPEGTMLNVTIPLVYIAFTTVGLPWQLANQIALSWVILLCGVGAKTIGQWGTTVGFTETVGRALAIDRGELTVLLAGVVTSVLVAHLLRERKLANFSSILERTGELPFSIGLERRGDATRYEVIEKPAHRELERYRLKRLFWGILGLGIYSNLVSTLSVLGADKTPWPWALAGWGVLVVILGLLLYLNQLPISNRKIFQIGGLFALTLCLWPSILLLGDQPVANLWLLWPLCFVIALGLIPWSLEELLPLGAITSVAAIEIVSQLKLGVPGAIAFGLAPLLGLFICASSLRRLKERWLLLNFHEALQRTRDEKEVLRVLGDALVSLFDASSALISIAPEHVELIQSGRSFPILQTDWPLHRLRQQLEPLEYDRSGIGVREVSWLPSTWAFVDRRFGVFSSIHGLLLEIDPARTRLDAAEGEERPFDGRQVEGRQNENRLIVFVGLSLPFVQALRGSEIRLARSLGGFVMLQLQAFAERKLRVVLAQQHEVSQTEREYELSTLVHDINNTVQDLTLLCDSILDSIVATEGEAPGNGDAESASLFAPQLRRIAVMARSMATVVSDAKRKRELERIQDLTPRELIEVNEILGEIVSFAAVRAERKRILVKAEGLGAERLWIKISAREHLETIIRNLLNNATMYSDPGSTVQVKLRYSANEVFIDVCDNGPGLSADECKAIFLSGYRGKSGAPIPGGLGLGLAQSRRVAESAHGTLEVFSAGAGLGSTFTVTLPRQAAPTVPKGERSWALMVDDQPTLTDFYARIARALHLVPIVAGSVTEAVALLEARGGPSFMLTDLHLGSGDGLDLIKFVRDNFGLGIPILVVSGHNDQDIEERVRRAGATDFVSKPISRQALFARIQSLLPAM